MATFEFPNRPVSRPHVSVSIDASGIGGSTDGSAKPLALIGSASGGDPDVVYMFTSYLQAKQVLRSGDLLDAMEMAWNPGPDQVGAGPIYVNRVENATPATGTSEGITFTSKLFGLNANSIHVFMEDNGLTGAKDITVVFGPDNYRQKYSGLGNMFTVQYTGEAAASFVEVTKNATTGLAESLVIKSGADEATATVARTYDLTNGSYPKMSNLITDINNIPGYSATFVPYGSNKDIDSIYLDAVTSQDIKTAPYMLTALGGDIVNQIKWDAYVSATYDPAVGITDNFSLDLTGGTNGEVPLTWADKLGKFATEDVYYITPLTSDEAIHAEVSQFVNDQSENGHAMRAIVGGGVKETMSELFSRQATLRNQRVSLVGVSGSYTFSDGRQVDIPAYMIAAEIAGLRSGLGVAEPVTFKYINLTGLDTYYTSPQLDTLNQAGILTVEYVRNRSITGYRVVSDVTTFNDPAEPVMNNAATGELTDFLMSDLRYTLENTFVGTKLHLNSASLIKNRVQSFLDEAMRDPDSMVVDYVPDDVKVIISNNRANISFVVQPAVGLDYIQVSGVYVPFTSTADGTTTA